MSIINRFLEILTTDLKIYWFFAIFGTALLFVQLALTLFGMGGGDDVDGFDGGVDVDGDGAMDFSAHHDTGLTDFKFFSFRSLIAFITFFGWGGVLWGKNGLSGFFGALGSGLSMMFATAIMIFFLMKLQHSGNITSNDIVGCTGRVYLTVPPGKTDNGKVTVTVKGCTREIKAVAEEELPKGTPVTVVSHIDGKLYQVKKI